MRKSYRSVLCGVMGMGAAGLASTSSAAKADCRPEDGRDYVVMGRIQVNDPGFGGVKDASNVEIRVSSNRMLETAPVWVDWESVNADAEGNFRATRSFGRSEYPCADRQVRVQVRLKSEYVDVKNFGGDDTITVHEDAHKSELSVRNIGARVFNQSSGSELRDEGAVDMAKAYVEALGLMNKMLAESDMEPVTVSYRTGTETRADVGSNTVILDDDDTGLSALYKAMWDIWYQNATRASVVAMGCGGLSGDVGYEDPNAAFRAGFIEFADAMSRYEMGLRTKPSFAGCESLAEDGIDNLAEIARHTFSVREALNLLVDNATFPSTDLILMDVLAAFAEDPTRESVSTREQWYRNHCADGLYLFVDRINTTRSYTISDTEIQDYKNQMNPECPARLEPRDAGVVIERDAGTEVERDAAVADAGAETAKDAGAMIDAGTPQGTDAGHPNFESDAETDDDAGTDSGSDTGSTTTTPTPPRGAKAGCTVAVRGSSDSIVAMGGLLGLGLLARKRRRRSA